MRQLRVVILLCTMVVISGVMTADVGMFGEDRTQNYITTAVITTPIDDLGCIDTAVSRVTTVYFDGFGRKIQTVHIGASPYGHGDIVEHMEYDGRGLSVRQWNPVPGFNRGAFTPLTELSSNYTACDIGDGITDFTDTRYSREPQPRVLEVRQAGESWHVNQGTRYEYYGNEPTGELSCVRWNINSDGILERTGNYPCGELRVTKTTDEDGRVILRFVNRKGEAILERRIISGTTYADTYYVYDIYGNLRYILPPKASAEMTTDGEYSHEHATLKGLCYSYSYDYRNRVQTKRLPGCRHTEYAYDCTDRLIGQYSPLMIADGIKQFTIYDNEGRVVYETYGTSTNTLTQMNTQLQDKRVVSGYEGENGLFYGYTIPEALSSWITISKQDVKIVNYYDNYDFLTLPDYAFCADSLQYEADANYGERYVNTLNPTISTSSRLTGSVTKTSGGEVMLTVYYYDSHGNIIQTCSTNHMGGYDRYKRLYSYDNLLMATHHNHSTSDTTYQIRNTYTYDNIGRLISETMQINNRKEIILQTNRYDAVGRLSAQQLPLGGNIQYSYNQRGWITDINSLHFDQTLYYDVQPNGESGYLNGNLSAQEFSISEGAGTVLSPSSYLSGEYRYGYDGMDRLRSAVYTETVRTDNNGESVSVGTHIYSDPSYTTQYGYDLNSNPTVIIRYGMQCTDMEQEEGASPRYIHRYSKTDHLLMTYEGNRLVKVTDRGADCTYEGATDFVDGSAATVEYAYDNNGNMTRDLNKRISLITYDYLNLPDFVRFTDDHLIWYDYDSMGNRLSTTYGTLTNGVFTPEIGSLNPDEDENPYVENLYIDLRRDYCGEFIYEDGELERILTSNGYYKNGKYYFYIKDWQGNNRLTVGGLSDAIQTGGIIINPTLQTSVVKDAHVYYPYGMRFADVFEGTADRFQYGGKEIDRFSGLDLHDFSARWYDSQLCRFTTPDPLQEKYPHLSPYLYCAANPLRYTDPTGKEIYIEHRYGFLGLKTELLHYKKGKLYTSSGDEYNKELTGFLKETIEALSQIAMTKTGEIAIGNLSDSKHKFVIKKGNNKFKEEKRNSAQLKLIKPDISENNKIGSGGVVFWDPNISFSGPNERGNLERPAFIGLAHELGHALSAEKGMMDFRIFSQNHYDIILRNVTYDEYNAVEFENEIRLEYNIPLRIGYTFDSKGNIFMEFIDK